MVDSSGKLVAEPLRRGASYCRFHIQTFTHTPAIVSGALCLIYLDLETTGTSVAECRIVELAAAQALDTHLPGASFAQVVNVPSQIVSAPGAREAAAVHGISDEEISIGPPFPVVWERFLWFVEQVANTAVEEEWESDDEVHPPRPPDQAIQVALAAHNGYYPQFVSLCRFCVCTLQFDSVHVPSPGTSSIFQFCCSSWCAIRFLWLPSVGSSS